VANNVNGLGGASGGTASSGGGGTGDFEAVFAESERIQEQAITRSLEVSQMRTEAGSAREAARNANLQ